MTKTQLAIAGGEPAITLPAPPWPPKQKEIGDALRQLANDGSWSHYTGRSLERLTERLTSYLDVPHVHLCSSGTIAVELALRGLGVGPGDEVILAGYDFPGNFRAIESIGARPVLIDLARGRWVIDVEQLGRARSPLTKALVASHLHGELADIDAIRAWGEEHQIAIVEDACQVPGALVRGRRAGTIGQVGVFSFGGSKLLTAGRGGAAVTRHPEVLQRIKIFSERGNDAFPISQLQAAVLQPQMDVLDELNERRGAAAKFLGGQVSSLKLFECSTDEVPNGTLTAYYKLGLWVTEPSKREAILAALQAEGVEVGSAFRGFVQRSSKRCRRYGELTNCRLASHGTILLHHRALLGDQDYLEQVARAFSKVDVEFS